jgi:enoyl-CoA hydratase/carnithine racemase
MPSPKRFDDVQEEAVQKSYPLAEAVIQSEDLHEGIRAFIENRRPNWQGK